MKNQNNLISVILSVIINIVIIIFLFSLQTSRKISDSDAPVSIAMLVSSPNPPQKINTPAQSQAPRTPSVTKQKSLPIIPEQPTIPAEPQHTPSGDDTPATPLQKGNYETANGQTVNSAETGESNEDKNNSSLTKSPTALYMPKISYPRVAKNAKIEGTAEIAYIIDENGRVNSVEILSVPHISFESVIKKAVMSWRFAPATRDGKPVSIKATKTIVFKLD